MNQQQLDAMYFELTQRSKYMKHDRCGGTVSHKTLLCAKCKQRPVGTQVTLMRRQS